VQHHIKALVEVGLVETFEGGSGSGVEKFYKAKGGGFLLQEIVLPKSDKPVVIISGSHDLALERLAERQGKYLTILTLPVGSLDGLVNLRQGLCQLTGAHLLSESGEYNLPYVRHFFPDRTMELFTLAHRTQGLIVASNNPKGIHSLADLTREDVTFLNRNPGSGTRLWLDQQLVRLGIPPAGIRGYEYSVRTHSDLARAVQSGVADVSLGIQAAAHAFDLGFIPLFEERYDLILPAEQEGVLAPLLDDLQSSSFRHVVESLTGYQIAHSGEQLRP
jgi:putative molybdopterin biosynthesis protein